MSNYVDLVLVKLDNDYGTWLFYAPWMSRLKKGDIVIVDGRNPALVSSSHIIMKKGEVVRVIEVKRNSEEYNFIMEFAHTKHLRRVLSRAVPYDYTDEESED